MTLKILLWQVAENSLFKSTSLLQLMILLEFHATEEYSTSDLSDAICSIGERSVIENKCHIAN
jgi:hypothetical protein